MSDRSAPRYTLFGLGIITLVVALALVLARPAQSDNTQDTAARPANTLFARDGDAVPVLQPGRQPFAHRARRQAGIAIEPLGRFVQRLDMVVARRKEVANLLIGLAGAIARGPFVAQFRRHRVAALGRLAISSVQRHQRPADFGHVGDQLTQFGGGDVLPRLGCRVAQVGDETRFLILGE